VDTCDDFFFLNKSLLSQKVEMESLDSAIGRSKNRYDRLSYWE